MPDFYRKPFIYLPKNKITPGGVSPTPVEQLIGIPESANKIQSTGSRCEFWTLWLNSTPYRTSSSRQDLVIDDRKFYFNMSYASTADKMCMMIVDAKITDANINKPCWDSNRSNVSLQHIYYRVRTASGWKLYKVDYGSQDSTYGQYTQYVSGSVSGLPSGSSGYVNAITYRPDRYKNLRDNQTIQNEMSTYPSAQALFIFFGGDITDDELKNLGIVFDFYIAGDPVETLTI